ncbi:uncharacterized protein LOC112047098 [Bicyclus anynana]|uniref:Uncharacterized protein LOC112047098 n=1 Tax=Bicyclus anynana TaxID=110368 RepID=A0A6J1N466_BICAN|nr:uncharacterized protein LOC112047098 [Bicyclus anynana]
MAHDTSPVFVLDYDKVLDEVSKEANPFTKIKSSDFSDVIEIAIKRSKIVILFVEETLCTEDVTIKDNIGTPFYHLGQAMKENKVTYLPSVSQAYKTLKSHLQALASYVFYLSDSSSELQVYDGRLRHFYIYFKDKINETRSIALRRHDLLIKEVYSVVRQVAAGPVVAFYTGKVNPIDVDALNTLPTENLNVRPRPGVTVFSNGALFRFIGVSSSTSKRRSMFSQVPVVSDEKWKERGLHTRMSYTEFELEFEFSFKDDRWTVDSVALLEWGEEVGRTDLRAGAPWNWSYVCSEPLVLVNMRDGSAVTIAHYQVSCVVCCVTENWSHVCSEPLVLVNMRDGSAVTIAHYQIQPFINHAALRQDFDNPEDLNPDSPASSESPEESPKPDAGSHKFGPAVNCGPYFSAHILAGLMVTSMCLGILTYGVVSMYNINTNSRYDDPQAKPLVIMAEGGGH